ncbi:GGDEF/EAL domain-containing response regulator [Ramlibacter sp. Leaf400]|uniref:GGDEF/EAL domain-containing response regulator n=1 Tax=Ramlibacter sp. Leaf400 TaxID=1736365 RepID=UPI0006F88E62|nr:EAL domain-containing protein [Ramlibacter sp. Leaf400]KQT11039.1 hypothetical protein ASG30_09635 [Ramlibacter sp. Leaf400]
MNKPFSQSNDPGTVPSSECRESELDALATVPTMFAPGDDRLSQQEFGAHSRPAPLGPQGGSMAGLPDSLIMMVDDEILNIEMTQAFLLEAGYRHFASTDAPELAVDAMRAQPPGVLLLDLSMPRVSGLDILEAMGADPVLRHVPVIVLTSSTDPQVKLKALSMGAMDFLSKPVDPSELALRLRNTLTASAYRDYLRQHDPLTGLPNKQRFRQDVARVLASAQSEGRSGALLLVGVDALGRVNDALGRASGDNVLKRIAKRLAACVQTEAGGELSSAEGDPTLYRLDGDEFAVIVPHIDGTHSAAAFINKLLDDAAVSYQRRDSPELFVTCSIGVVVFPSGGNPELLAGNAGLALRHAKQAGSHRYEFFSPRFTELAQNRLDLSAELRRAIGRDEVELLFEPRVELATGRLRAAQGVLRWKHASGRVVEGDELMDLARASEMNVALVEWVLDRLRQSVRNWRGAGLHPVPVGIGASLANLRLVELGHLVSAAVASGLEPQQLTLELQHLGGDSRLAEPDAKAIAMLRKKGVRLSLDRFGSVTSVAHLRMFQCEEIKIDASFVQQLEKDARTQAILLGMGDLARRLNLDCIAPGVGSSPALAFLRKNGWQQGQGRLFGEPLAAVPFAAQWLTRTGKPQRAELPLG